MNEDSFAYDIRKDNNFSNIKNHFLSLTEKADSCWLWHGVLDRQRYGIMKANSKTYRANRLSYMLFNGPIYCTELVRHTCDNPQCVNPVHLIKGTKYDNSLDCVKRNRHPNMKLNEESVKVIKWMLKYQYKKGLIKKLASLHGVNIKTISDINCNNTWRWINI